MFLDVLTAIIRVVLVLFLMSVFVSGILTLYIFWAENKYRRAQRYWQ